MNLTMLIFGVFFMHRPSHHTIPLISGGLRWAIEHVEQVSMKSSFPYMHTHIDTVNAHVIAIVSFIQ